jgi:hypothetical protein
MSSSKMKIAYVITEREGKHYWNRIGVAFVNRDGSLNVRLEAIPVKGELQIRDYVPKDETAGPFVRSTNGNGQVSETLAELA